MDECPICFEELSNTTSRVTTECCNNVLHLGCLKNCDYKCPFCRNEIITIIDDTTPLITESSVRSLPVIHYRYCRRIGGLVMIFMGVYYITVVLNQCFNPCFPPPPPPPEIPPWPETG